MVVPLSKYTTVSVKMAEYNISQNCFSAFFFLIEYIDLLYFAHTLVQIYVEMFRKVKWQVNYAIILTNLYVFRFNETNTG